MLKDQTLGLIEQLKTLLVEVKPKKFGIHLNDDEPQAIKLKKAEVYTQQLKITALQHKISHENKQLEYVYDSIEVMSKESEVKVFQKEIK